MTSGRLRQLVVERPDVVAARAAVAMALENVRLAKAMRRPDLQIGPMWQRDDNSCNSGGFKRKWTFPSSNTGVPLVEQRMAELRQQQITAAQLENRAILEARAAILRYERARRLVEQSRGELEPALLDALEPFDRSIQGGADHAAGSIRGPRRAGPVAAEFLGAAERTCSGRGRCDTGHGPAAATIAGGRPASARSARRGSAAMTIGHAGSRDSESQTPIVLRFGKPILFVIAALCLAGVFAGLTMPASVFPQTDFPRVVILIDNGVMPGDEMMATITRPVEEAMKYIPGTVNIRSTTGRGSAAVNVFFDWSTNMEESEQYVLGRLAQIRNTLPPTVDIQVHRLTFSAFPILGISLTSETRSKTDLWETARYDIYPRFLRIEGVARINLVGGRVPEYHVVVDPSKLDANHLTFSQVTQALADTNLFTPAGMHEENYQLYLVVVDNRLHDPREIEDVVVAWINQAPVRVRDVAIVRRGEAPQFNRVSADGKDAVLLNIYGQPGCNTVQIADDLQQELQTAATRSAARHETGLLLRSVAVRAGRRPQRLGGDHSRPGAVGRRAVRVPAKRVGHVGRGAGDSGHDPVDADRPAAAGNEFQPDDAGRHRGGGRDCD